MSKPEPDFVARHRRRYGLQKCKQTVICEGKKTFETRLAAQNFALRGSMKYGFPKKRAYKCPICNKFHLTKQKPRGRKR